MDAPTLARTLAVVNTAADAALVWSVQRTYDLPRSRRRLGLQCALGAGYTAVLLASDAVWAASTRDPEAGHEPGTALPAHESALTLRLLATSAAWGLVWWAGRGVPDRLRRRGVRRPNRLLAPPLALGFAATTAPAWWAHARGREG